MKRTIFKLFPKRENQHFSKLQIKNSPSSTRDIFSAFSFHGQVQLAKKCSQHDSFWWVTKLGRFISMDLTFQKKLQWGWNCQDFPGRKSCLGNFWPGKYNPSVTVDMPREKRFYHFSVFLLKQFDCKSCKRLSDFSTIYVTMGFLASPKKHPSWVWV